MTSVSLPVKIFCLERSACEAVLSMSLVHEGPEAIRDTQAGGNENSLCNMHYMGRRYSSLPGVNIVDDCCGKKQIK